MYKLTHEELIRYFSDFGYQWLEYLNDDNKYKGVFTKVLLKCPNGHYYKTTYNKFKKGTRCGECYGNKKFGNDVVNEVITSRGFKLLSNYKNMRTKVKLQCPKGHIFYTNFNYFKRTKHGCPECYNRSPTTKEVKEYIEKEGYKLISDKYLNDRTKIKLECSKGHVYEVTFYNFKKGKRCNKCRSLSYEEVKSLVEELGHELLSEYYESTKQKLKIKCSKGHIFYKTLPKLKYRPKCPECIKGRNFSDKEREIQRYVSKLVKGVVWNDRTQITNPLTNYKLELDVWIPDLNKAIEFNGKYYHTNDKVKTRDKIKKEECLKKGIDLLVVNEKDYMKDKEKVLETVKNFIGGY